MLYAGFLFYVKIERWSNNKQKNMKKIKTNKGKIIIYQSKKSGVEFKVKLKEETVWLNLDQMALLFGRDKSVISRHIKNVFEEKELKRKSVVANFATTAMDGKIYNVDYYNLDIIISVGYRVKSQKGVRFRIWATNVLKKYLVDGYVINQERLLQVKNKFNQLQETIAFLQKKSDSKLLQGQEKELLDLLGDYSKTLTLLHKYDNSKLKQLKNGKSKFVLKYNLCLQIITELKNKLAVKKEASSLFGNEVDHKFEGVVGNLYQTFAKKELYSSIEEKAANFLYLTIKDHPFSNGNKRIASFLFVYFLDRNNYLYKESGEKKINNNALTALALLVAESHPKEKEQIIALISQLLG